MLFCRYCGNKAPDDAMFCGNCGKRFTLPSFEPTSINNISQSVPSNSQKAEEERSRRSVIIKNTMYVVGWFTDNLYAINLDTHTLRCHIHVNNQQGESLFATNGLLYVNTSGYPSRISTLYALRADNGQHIWSKNNFYLQF